MSHSDVMASIVKPTLLIDEIKARQHIEKMAIKIEGQANFRPHFKTHQSAEIGEWFRDNGIHAISVSSVSMAEYFAQYGWSDILITVPVNIREMEQINNLASQINLNLLVDSVYTAKKLTQKLKFKVKVWVEIDTGSHRTGVPWKDTNQILQITTVVEKAQMLVLEGLLTYVGKSYQAINTDQIKNSFHEAIGYIDSVRTSIDSFRALKISVGDTPSCSVLQNFGYADELRPGNFVLYDMMQVHIGSCLMQDIAIGVACPIITKHIKRNEIVIYGGAAHLSKDFVLVNGEKVYGKIALLTKNGWKPIVNGNLIKVSQEHGIVLTDRKICQQLEIGQLLVVLPAHACLTADLYDHYLTLDGRMITKMKTNTYGADSQLATD